MKSIYSALENKNNFKLWLNEFTNLTMNRNKFNRAKGVNCNKPLRRSYGGNSESPRENRDDFHNRPRPPPHLKGKALGLWYRDKNREKKAKLITLEHEKLEEIETLLSASGSVVKGDGLFRQKFLRDRSMTFETKLDMSMKTPNEQNYEEDEMLYKELTNKINHNDSYKKMFEFRKKLPVFKKRHEIVDKIEKNQVVVISGETGSGKTTQIVQYVLDDYIQKMKGSLCRMICTQPRRISAITVAERVAAERAEALGISVGYSIRLQSELPSRLNGVITFKTTGVLIQELQTNPSLQGISHLFIDEIHERDTLSDFLLTLLKFILPKRPDLKIILMSATLNAEKFSEYFGGAPLLHIPGFSYHVDDYYLEDILQNISFRFPRFTNRFRDEEEDTSFKDFVLPYVNNLEKTGVINKSVAAELRNPNSEALDLELICAVIHHICIREPEGAILVFVPGLSQIIDIMKMLKSNSYFSPRRTEIIPMHSIMTTAVQKTAFSTPPHGIRKIIISTNICETSITIDDVRYVVDCGKNKTTRFDIARNVATLRPEWETLANAKQRKGRAGRTQSGKCYKLFTTAREENFELFPCPEIQRCRLEDVILKAKTLQVGSIEPFLEKLMDPPEQKMVHLALKMLTTLNLLDSDERLTPLGYHVSRLPLDCQTGKMILMGAVFSCLDPILSVAACLSHKDPFEFIIEKEREIREKRKRLSKGEKSDHYALSNAVIGWEEANESRDGFYFAHDNFLSVQNLKFISKMKKQFAEALYSMKFLGSPDPKHPDNNVNSHNPSLVKAIICSGLYPNVAMIKKVIKSGSTGEPKSIILTTIDHKTVHLSSNSLLNSIKTFESSYIVYFEIMKSTSINIYEGTMVYPMMLLFFGEKCRFQNEAGHVVVDEFIKFPCAKRTAKAIQELRKELLYILENAALNPGVLDWKRDTKTILILKSIIQLITSEDKTTGNDFDVEMV